jgi:pentatricopeptide repeat protein
MEWFSVRSVYRFEGGAKGRDVYEERVVLFKAEDFDAAIAKAEIEADGYVADLEDGEVVPIFQCYAMVDEPGDGAEIFSLMRVNDLEPDTYIDHFFDTGEERQRLVE